MNAYLTCEGCSAWLPAAGTLAHPAVCGTCRAGGITTAPERHADRKAHRARIRRERRERSAQRH